MTEKSESGKRVNLKVVTLSGNYVGDFNVHQKLQHVIEKAFHALHIVPAPNERWILRHSDTDLDPQKTIEESNLPDGATLNLAPVEGGGGHGY